LDRGAGDYNVMFYPSNNRVTTPESICLRAKELDAQYGTWKISPLHHDNVCRLCRVWEI